MSRRRAPSEVCASTTLPGRDHDGLVVTERMQAPAREAARHRPSGDAELQVIYDTAPVGLCVLDAEGRFVRINARMAEINGIPAADHVGRTIREVVPALADAGEALHRRIMNTGRPVLGVEIEGETPAAPGARRVWVEDWSPLLDASGRVCAVNVVAREVTAERTASRTAREREALLTAVLEALPVGVGLIDTAGRLTIANREMRRFVPEVIPSRDTARRERWRGHHPDGRRIESHDYPGARALRGETVVPGVEFLCELEPEREVWTRVAAAPLRAEDGQVTGAVTVVSDISALKAAETQRALLTRELGHRVKNALTVVLAALRLTPRHGVADYARAVEGRVLALARAHDLLTQGAWQGAALRSLIEAELAPFLGAAIPLPEGTSRPPAVELDGPALWLTPAGTQAIAMTMHELATNAVKHGALSRPGGTVSLAWRSDDAAGLLRLHWQERGGPRVAGPPTRRGFGSRMLDATIRRQLAGEVTLRWAPSGLVCDVELPLALVLDGDAGARAGQATSPGDPGPSFAGR